MTKFIRNQKFDVFSSELLLIDTVFYQERLKMTTEEVRRELINHDGYDASITVRKAL